MQAFGVEEADKYAQKYCHSRLADAGRISKAARRWCEQSDPPTIILMKQSKASKSCQATFLFKRHVCNPSWCCLSDMFQTTSVQLILIFLVLQREAVLLAPPFQYLRQCFTRAIELKPSSMAAEPRPTALMDVLRPAMRVVHLRCMASKDATKDHIIKMG